MRISPLLVALAVPVLAVAAEKKTKPADLEKIVKQHVLALTKDTTDEKLALAKDRVIIAPTLDFTTGAPVVKTFREGINGPLTHKLAKPTFGIDDANGIAYFQATVNTAIKLPDELYKGVDRIGGIMVRNGATWEFGALMYSRDLDVDAKVVQRAYDNAEQKEVPVEPTITGDSAIGATVRGWFKTGFAPVAAKTGTRIASGTAPREFQTNAGAVKLAMAWDNLGLGVRTVHVTKVGTVAFVKAEVVWTAKLKKESVQVPMLLGMVVVPHGTDWRWVSMQFAPI